jgi:hypothetical protein
MTLINIKKIENFKPEKHFGYKEVKKYIKPLFLFKYLEKPQKL